MLLPNYVPTCLPTWRAPALTANHSLFTTTHVPRTRAGGEDYVWCMGRCRRMRRARRLLEVPPLSALPNACASVLCMAAAVETEQLYRVAILRAEKAYKSRVLEK